MEDTILNRGRKRFITICNNFKRNDIMEHKQNVKDYIKSLSDEQLNELIQFTCGEYFKYGKGLSSAKPLVSHIFDMLKEVSLDELTRYVKSVRVVKDLTQDPDSEYYEDDDYITLH